MARWSIAYVVVFVGVAAYAPYLQPYYASLGIGLDEVGLLTAFAAAVGLLGAPAWGALHDRFPRRRALLPLAAVLAAAGGTGIILAGRSPLLVPAVATFAIGTAGLMPMMDVQVLDLVRADRSRYGLVRAWGSVGFIAGSPLIGLAIDARGPGAFAVPLVVAWVLGAGLLRSSPTRTNAVRFASTRRPPVLRNRTIALFLLASLMAWAAVYLQLSFFSIYLLQLGASSDRVGWAWSLGAALEVPTMLLFPRLAARFGSRRLIVLGAAILALREVANVASADPDVLLAVSILQGTGYALLLVGGVTFVSAAAPDGAAATAQGILSGVSVSLASVLGASLGGIAASALTIRVMFALAAGLGLLAVGLIGWVVQSAARPAGAERAPAERTVLAPASLDSPPGI